MNNGDILYFPSGVYNFNVNQSLILIDKPMTLLGDGNSIILNKGEGNIIDVKLETEEKRFVTIKDISLDEYNTDGKCVNIISEENYYLSNFSMINVKCFNGEYGFYINGVTNDNLFIASFEKCLFWNNGFYGNKIGDTIKITGCQFAFDGGIYLNQVSGATSLEFNNNNVTCTDGFKLENNTSAIIINNIFEFTRDTNNNNGYVEICSGVTNRMYEVMIISNTFSYSANYQAPNKPLLYIGKTGRTKILSNFIGVKENNYSVVLSANSNTTEFDSTFGISYSSPIIEWALHDLGSNSIIKGNYVNGSFYDGKQTSYSYEKYTGKKSITGHLQIINGNPTFASNNGNVAINHATYVDDYNVSNEKNICFITSDGILPVNLLIGGLSNHCRIRFMSYSLPTDDLQTGDLFINKTITQSLPYPLYYYDGTSVKGFGTLNS